MAGTAIFRNLLGTLYPFGCAEERRGLKAIRGGGGFSLESGEPGTPTPALC